MASLDFKRKKKYGDTKREIHAKKTRDSICWSPLMLAQSNVNACTLDTGPPGLKQDRYMSAAWEFTQWANAVYFFCVGGR